MGHRLLRLDALGEQHGVDALLKGLELAPPLRRVVEGATIAVGEGLRVTISLGVAGLVPGGSDPARWQEAVRQADDAMYQAKAAGRNRAVAAHLRR